MLFLVGEKVRSTARPLGEHRCAVCKAPQPFGLHEESMWFSLFTIPLLPLEKIAAYWRCENCLSAYQPNQLDEPSCVPLVRRVSLYLLLGYNQHDHIGVADDICQRVTGFGIEAEQSRELVREIAAGRLDMVAQVEALAHQLNIKGKQQVLEAAFLATYVCCDLQYEDRLRINLMGNALGVGLEFVEFAISQVRKQGYYGIRRLGQAESEA